MNEIFMLLICQKQGLTNFKAVCEFVLTNSEINWSILFRMKKALKNWQGKAGDSDVIIIKYFCHFKHELNFYAANLSKARVN